MEALSALSAQEAKGLRGLIFDLDDTVLDHGRLSEAAYAAMWQAKSSGLQLVACTGRPASWGELVALQWPVDAAVAENGAVAYIDQGRTCVRIDSGETADRERLLALAQQLLLGVPDAALATDNRGRMSDVTIDIGEYRKVGPEQIARMREQAEALGVRTTVSSVHLHLSFSSVDKASGTLAALKTLGAISSTALRYEFAFVGDSGNDAAAFAAFHTTVGVANVRRIARQLSVPPRFVCSAPMGAGFAELVAHLVRSRLAA